MTFDEDLEAHLAGQGLRQGDRSEDCPICPPLHLPIYGDEWTCWECGQLYLFAGGDWWPVVLLDTRGRL